MINACLSSLQWETKLSFSRDVIVVLIMGLLSYFGLFFDFPFQEQQQIPYGGLSEFIMVLIIWNILLAIFSRTITRDLDQRLFFNPFPIHYRLYVLGKCLYLFLILLLITSIEVVLRLAHQLHYGSSLIPANYHDIIEEFYTGNSENVFITGLIVFVSLFRPFHYVLIVLILSAVFYASKTWPELAYAIPTLTMEDRQFGPSLAYGFGLCAISLFLFERKMIYKPRLKSRSGKRIKQWLLELHIAKWAPVLLTLLLISASTYLVYERFDETGSDSAFRLAGQALSKSIQPLRNQNYTETAYFSFNNAQQDQWIADLLMPDTDWEWQQLHHEFGLDFDPERQRIDIFIKPSQQHQLGSTRGAFIIINTDPVSQHSDTAESRIKNTFRHELTHVLINELSSNQFQIRNDILNGFLHEGLATLAENHWDNDQQVIINQAALYYGTLDQDFFELLPKIGFFSEYDYSLNYSLGYVFWSEFVKRYGRKKATRWLIQLGEPDPEDYQFSGIWYLFHKAALQDIDLYQIFYASRQILEKTYQKINPGDQQLAIQLQHLKTVRLTKQEILLPYVFKPEQLATCHFRKKNALTTQSTDVVDRDFSGTQGGVCADPGGNPEQMQVTIRLQNGLWYYSPWIEIPE